MAWADVCSTPNGGNIVNAIRRRPTYRNKLALVLLIIVQLGEALEPSKFGEEVVPVAVLSGRHSVQRGNFSDSVV